VPTDKHPKELTAAQNKEILKYAVDTRKLELQLFWTRSLFFWGFIAAAFIAYGVSMREPNGNIALLTACFGSVCSLAWTLINRANTYWRDVWNKKVDSVDKKVLGRHLFGEQEDIKLTWLWGPLDYSMTRLTTALSDFTVIVWIILAAFASPYGRGISWSCIPIAISAGTIIWMLAMVIWGRQKHLLYSN
jgi:uncharacterized membrane protein YqgA involved in biofilm formation